MNGMSHSWLLGTIKTRFSVPSSSVHLHIENTSNAGNKIKRGAGRLAPHSVIAYPSIPRSFAAVPPRILIRSSSLSPGIAVMWSTGAVFHGNG